MLLYCLFEHGEVDSGDPFLGAFSSKEKAEALIPKKPHPWIKNKMLDRGYVTVVYLDEHKKEGHW